MDSNSEVVFDAAPFVRVFKDGRVERFIGTAVAPPSVDPDTGVSSKDVVIDPDTGVWARLYLPGDLAATTTDPKEEEKKKLPVLVYYHGGGFCVETAASPTYHNYLNSLVAQAGVLAVSVDYRRAPEHPLPAAYEDSWAALRWVASHASAAGGGGTEPWLADHADFGRLFLAGDSAGANIVHNLAMGAGGGKEIGHGVAIEGAVLTHPYFWGNSSVGSETTDPATRAKLGGLWTFVCPSAAAGNDDPRMNPSAEGAPSLAALGCRRVLVCVAEKDFLRERGRHYCEKLKESGWEGAVEILESEGEDHVFHLMNPSCEKAAEKMKRLVFFLGAA